MGESKNSPNLRFKFSNQELKRTPLSDPILELESGVSVNSKSEPSTDKRNLGVLKTSCVFSGKFIPGENKAILEEEISRAKVSPKANTIIVSRMNTPQLVGESGFISDDFENLFLPDRLWLATINAKKINPRYLSFSLIAPRTRANISSIATGTSGSMKNISKPNFLGIELHIPSLPEQEQIASFLSSVNERIELLEQKKEKLEVYKKGVMQQIFSQQIRFRQDDGTEFPDWEERGLGDLGEFYGGGTPTSSKKNY